MFPEKKGKGGNISHLRFEQPLDGFLWRKGKKNITIISSGITTTMKASRTASKTFGKNDFYGTKKKH